MLKHTGTVLPAAVVAVLMAVLTATSSLAATGGVREPLAAAPTVKVTPGGPFTATSGKVTFGLGGSAYTCGSSKATGTFKKSGSGTHIGRINTFKFSGCKGVTGLSFTITPTLPWYINVTGFDQTKGQVLGTISSIIATVSFSSCSFTVAGTSATAGGTNKFVYTNSTGGLDLLATGGNLHAWNVSGCLGLISNGDPASYSADYSVKPVQTIS
jgi:hypothetical protein